MQSVPYHLKPQYLLPAARTRPLHRNLHLELEGLRHDELLREQAQIERFVRTSRVSSVSVFAEVYENEVRQKEVRIAALLAADAVVGSQQLKMKRVLLEERMDYERMIEMMELNNCAVLGRRKTVLPTRYKQRASVLSTLDSTNIALRLGENSVNVQERTKALSRSQFNKTNQVENDPTISNAKAAKDQLLKQYQTNGFGSVSKLGQTASKKQEMTQKQQSPRQPKSGLKEHKDTDNELRKKRSFSSAQTKKNRVSFNLQANIISTPKQQGNQSCELPKHNQTMQTRSKAGEFKASGQQKIQNRLKLSQHRNTKHQAVHLLSVFSMEQKLRRGLRLRINNEPRVIQRHNIVVQGS